MVKMSGPKRNDYTGADRSKLSDRGLLSRPMGRHDRQERFRWYPRLQRYSFSHFFWVNYQIKIIKHRGDRIPFIESYKYWLMWFGNGLGIRADQNEESLAFATTVK